MSITTYELSDKLFLTIDDDDLSLVVGTLASPKKEIDLTPEETKGMIEMLIDNDMYDPWLV